MSINTNYSAQEAQINRMADLVCRGHGPSAIQVLNQCPFTDEQKTKITLLINQGPASDNLQEATTFMKTSIVAALNGEEIAAAAPDSAPQAHSPNQIIPLPKKELVCLPSAESLFYLNTFPQEIFQLIAFNMDMDFRIIGTCNLVCKQWYQVFNGQPVWRNLLSGHFPHNNAKTSNDFRGTFKTIYSNLSKGVYSQKTLGRLEFINIIDGKLIVKPHSGTIQFLDLNSFACTKTYEFPEKENPICCTADGKLVTLWGNDIWNMDKTSIWDLEKGQCIKTIEGNCRGSLAHEGRLFLGTTDGIEVYDLESGECTLTLKDEPFLMAICDLFAIADGKLFAHSNFGLIQVWDLKYHQCVHTFLSCMSIKEMTVIDGKLFTLDFSYKVKVWNLNTYEEIKSLSSKLGDTCALVGAHEKLFTTTPNGITKIWDLKSEACTEIDWSNTYAHGNSIQSASGKLIFHDSRYIVNVWDFTADHLTVFEEIAEALERSSPSDSILIIERFSKMPKNAQNAIFGKLYEIIKADLELDYWGCAEDIFFCGRQGQRQSASPQEKAQAIRNYLAEQRSNNQ